MDNESYHRQFMQRAIDLSRQNVEQMEGGPFGAVIVRDGEIIGEAHNRVLLTNDPTAHAEVEAIRAACRHIDHYALSGCVIYTSAEPCPMCLSAIYWARIDKIYYVNTRDDSAFAGFDDSLIYNQIPMPLQERSIPAVRLDMPEAATVMKLWKANAIHHNY